MKITKLLFTCMCCLIAASAVWGQAPNVPAKPGVLGYLDPHTGAFHPIPQIATEDAESPASTVTVGGTISLTIAITIKTAGITNVTCLAEASAFDNALSPTTYGESETVAATGTGTAKTCTLKIPYSWVLGQTSFPSDMMSTSYTIIGSVGATGLPQRSASRTPLDTRKIPANGTTTTLTAAVTL